MPYVGVSIQAGTTGNLGRVLHLFCPVVLKKVRRPKAGIGVRFSARFSAVQGRTAAQDWLSLNSTLTSFQWFGAQSRLQTYVDGTVPDVANEALFQLS